MSNRTTASTVEYSICLDTVNRDTSVYPDTNDITMNLDVAGLRRGTVQLSVGSVELPVPQFTIEETWKYICFDEGIRIVGEYAGRAIQIITPDNTYVALLPLYLNPISTLTVTDPTHIAVTTMYPHALATLANIWSPDLAGVPISLVGVSAANPAQLVLNTTNPGFVITGPSSFTVAITSTANLVNTVYPNAGYVSAPALVNPLVLCNVINNALSLVGCSAGTFFYDRLRSLFLFNTNSYGPVNPQVYVAELPTVPGEINLSKCMGFGGSCAGTNVRNKSDRWFVAADYGAYWRGSVAITPGFYTGDLSALGGDINIQFNRFNFDSADFLLFSNAIGTPITVTVPAGRYTPETLAQYLETEMNSQDPLSNVNAPSVSANVYTVQWFLVDPALPSCGSLTGLFIFRCNGVFGLEFADSTGSSMPLRLGFNNLSYRNGPVYESVRPVTIAVLGCSTTYYPSKTVQILAHTGRKGYRIDPTLSRAVACLATAGVFVYTLTSTTVAHGFQQNDVVRLGFAAAGLFGVQTRVSLVSDAFSFTVEAVNGLPFAIAPSTAVSVSLVADSSTLNVYFNYNDVPNSRQTNNSIYPSILGFDYSDLLAPAPFLSITTAMLEPPPYLLLQVLGLKGSSYIQHTYQGQNLTNILAKVIFFPNFQLQRGFPMSQTFNGSEILTQIQFRWLCPDHTLYQFHGRNWSATLEFIVMSEIPVLMCG